LRSETGGEVEEEEELGVEDTSGCIVGGSAIFTRVKVVCGGQRSIFKMKEREVRGEFPFFPAIHQDHRLLR